MKRFLLAIPVMLVCLAPVRGQTADAKKATVAYLQQLQQADGGFVPAALGPAAGSRNPSTLRATSSALRALKYFDGEPRDRAACVRYVEGAFDETSGGFVDVQPGIKPDVISTAIGLMAITELKMPRARYVEPAVKYLGENAKSFEEIRMAAAGLEAVDRRPPQADAWLEQLAHMRNADGTYGQGDGAARATGSAVVAVLRLGGKVEQKENVLKTLRAGQRKDGGFGKEGTTGSDLETSYRVLRAFHMLGEQPDAAACRSFVAHCRNEDGGYGMMPGERSSVSATYFAGIILHWLAEK